METTAYFNSDRMPALRILVVDDNRTNVQILQVFLKKLGHATIPAENGEQAVLKCASEKPDLVLLDIMMPVMDGFEAARQIRSRASDRWIPIIFLSALDREENLVAGLEAGGDDFMSKPINFVVLEAKMRSMQRMLLLQRKAMEALKRVEAISDNVLDAIVTIDTAAIIVACNASCERIFGWSRGEMLGQNVKMLMPEPVRGEHDTYVRNYVEGGPPQIMGFGREVKAVHKDGTLLSMELGVTEVRFDNERLFVGVIRDISDRKRAEEKLRENAEQLRRYYDETEAEAQLARGLIDQQLLRTGLTDPLLHFWLTPAQNFSGDVVAASRGPDGSLFALLADATGHGLTAAISTLPVLTIFYSMVPSGATLRAVISEINRQLRQSMPIGRFVALTLARLDESSLSGEIWVGGAPGALLLDENGLVIRHFESQQLPLGIIDSAPEMTAAVAFSWEGACQLLICSDGLIEAADKDGNQFGMDGTRHAVLQAPPHLRHEVIRKALAAHLEGLSAHDDISLLLIDCPAAKG